MRLDQLAPAVEPEDLGPSGAGLDQAEQEPDRRGLAGAVGAEVAERLARRDLEVEVLQGGDGAEMLGQALGAHSWRWRHGQPQRVYSSQARQQYQAATER